MVQSTVSLSFDLATGQPRARVVPVGLRLKWPRRPQERRSPKPNSVHLTHSVATICAAALKGVAGLARADRVPVLTTQAAWRDSVFVDHRIRHGLVPVIKQQRPHWVTGWTRRIKNAREIEPKGALRCIPANLGGAKSPVTARAPIPRPRTRAQRNHARK